MNEFSFEVETITSRPLDINDFIRLDGQIELAYRYLEDKNDDIKAIFKPILDAASDQACDLAYELGYDNPSELCQGGVKVSSDL